MIEKFNLNSIPVYRIEHEDKIEYRLFENTESTSVLFMVKKAPLGAQLDMVFEVIQDQTKQLRYINTGLYKNNS